MATVDSNIAEQWRTIDECPAYQVSDMGRVRRIEPRSGLRTEAFRPRMLKPLSGEYPGVTLRVDGRRVRRNVHRLVAMAFLGQPPVGTQVNHKNGNKHDARLDNLEYVTPSGNTLHAYRTGLSRVRRGEERGRVAKLTSEAVGQIKARWSKSYGVGVRLAREFGVSGATICDIMHGRGWSHVQATPGIEPDPGLRGRMSERCDGR